MAPTITTLREHIAWSYANLALADAALKEGAAEYTRTHYMIRNRLYNGLISESMHMRSLYDDERLKMTYPQACYYCGRQESLVVDHLIPRLRGGPDDCDNLIWACRTCNSSKGAKDMLEWMQRKGTFPAVLLLRRYVKIVARYCEEHDLLDEPLTKVSAMDMPFDVNMLPYSFPPLGELVLWRMPEEGQDRDAGQS